MNSSRDRAWSARFGLLVLAGLAATTFACTEQEFEPPDREEQVAVADTLFERAAFDTITWATDEARGLEGNAVYSAECRICHGPLGRGGTDYALDRDLEVPSLVEADWEYDGDLEAVRRLIFVGHPGGMPTWGVAGITLREIDASAYFIVFDLRAEVLGGG